VVCCCFVQGKLQDGCKILVFGASFDTTGEGASGDSGQHCVQLSLNGTRRARKDALLGYCRPEQLVRGLSLRTMATGFIVLLLNESLYLVADRLCRFV
jgi:hypothetical protein